MPKLWSESSEICKDWCWCYSWDCILHYEKTCHHRFFFFKIKINHLEYWNIYTHIAQKSSLLFWFKKLQQVIFLFPGYYEGKKLSYFQCDAKNKYIFFHFLISPIVLLPSGIRSDFKKIGHAKSSSNLSLWSLWFEFKEEFGI